MNYMTILHITKLLFELQPKNMCLEINFYPYTNMLEKEQMESIILHPTKAK